MVPVEVKSGQSCSLKSLHQFAGEKNSQYAIRFDTGNACSQKINTTTIRKASKSYPVQYQLISLPLYLVERLEAILEPVFLD